MMKVGTATELQLVSVATGRAAAVAAVTAFLAKGRPALELQPATWMAGRALGLRSAPMKHCRFCH